MSEFKVIQTVTWVGDRGNMVEKGFDDADVIAALKSLSPRELGMFVESEMKTVVWDDE